MQSRHPIETVGGLPVLTQDLMWKEDVPLYVTGKLAGLRLGPGAGNLEGARVGAERVVWGIQDMLERARRRRGKGDNGYGREVIDAGIEKAEDERMGEDDLKDQFAYNYCAGLGSRFASLQV